MGDEDRWERVRTIVREECERIEVRILAVLEKHGEIKNRVSFDGEWKGITDQLLKAWSSAYPAVDIQQDLKKAAAWILSNPQDAPKKQFGKFLMTWFSRSQDRSAIRAIPTRNDHGPGKKLCSYCERVSTGVVNGISHCSSHTLDAMDRKPGTHMWGVPAKNVAGDR